MPRGNDAAGAARELAERYNTTGNAEDLIASHRARRDPLLAEAQLLPADDDATAELAASAVKKEAGSGEVVSYTVRGDFVVYLVEESDGSLRKGVYARSGTRAASRLKKDGAPAPDPAVEAAQRDARIAAAAREAEAEGEEKAEKAREQAAEKAQKAAAREAKK